MDKRTIAGLVFIGIILFGFTWYNSKQQAEYNKQKAIHDSIEFLNNVDRITEQYTGPAESDPASPSQDSAKMQHLGTSLFNASTGQEQFYDIENDLMKITFSNKGGRVASVELKDYKTYKNTPLVLFPAESSKFDLSFFVKAGYSNAEIRTADYFFTPAEGSGSMTVSEDTGSFAMRLYVDSLSYVEYLYTVYKDNYMLDFNVRFVGMENVLSSNQSDLNVTWKSESFQNEKGFSNENNYTTVSYRFPGEKSIESLGISTDSKSEKINSKVNWIAFKQQFFSSIIIAPENFQNASVSYDTYQPSDSRIKSYTAEFQLPFTPQVSGYEMNFYFGPNKFSVLKQYDLGMERLVPLGGSIIGWINRLIVIPTFDILGKYISSYGLIILLMTILIKILIAPLTYKSYLSTAKMRLLKPDIDKLNEKYPNKGDTVKKQQATMELYKSAGVNPMGGCLPLLIQFPILIAMFRFFPASIELRGQQFLWADDLSSYDSILDLPFSIPFYGDHVSLFTLLMAVAMYITSRMNMSQTAGAGGQQMPGMKFMMLYLMPLMLLVWFNNYSSGLSYYYLLSNIITIGQTYAFRYAVSDEKLHSRMKENAKKPKKKSKWQQRYDDMLKTQQQQQRQQTKRK